MVRKRFCDKCNIEIADDTEEAQQKVTHLIICKYGHENWNAVTCKRCLKRRKEVNKPEVR